MSHYTLELLSESESLSTSESLRKVRIKYVVESLSTSELVGSTPESLSESESLSTSESLSESESLSTSESLSERNRWCTRVTK
ncbi:hypothetical protein ABLV89_02200 (plasmid) [Staphylococcus equorum]